MLVLCLYGMLPAQAVSELVRMLVVARGEHDGCRGCRAKLHTSNLQQIFVILSCLQSFAGTTQRWVR